MEWRAGRKIGNAVTHSVDFCVSHTNAFMGYSFIHNAYIVINLVWRRQKSRKITGRASPAVRRTIYPRQPRSPTPRGVVFVCVLFISLSSLFSLSHSQCDLQRVLAAPYHIALQYEHFWKHEFNQRASLRWEKNANEEKKESSKVERTKRERMRLFCCAQLRESTISRRI